MIEPPESEAREKRDYLLDKLRGDEIRAQEIAREIQDEEDEENSEPEPTQTMPTQTQELELAPQTADEKPMKQLAPFLILEQQARKMIAHAEAIALLPPTLDKSRDDLAMKLRAQCDKFASWIEAQAESLN